jgi:hypothetical protein
LRRRPQEARYDDGFDGDCTGNGHFADGYQIRDVELQSDAEHQQNDADLRKLLGEGAVGDEAWGIGTDEQPRREISDERREPEPLRDVAAGQCGGQRASECEDETDGVHFRLSVERRSRG